MLYDTEENVEVTFAVLGNFDDGTYPIIPAPEEVTGMVAGHAACVISIGEDIEAKVASGTVTVSHNGAEYTIEARGTTEDGAQCSISFSGGLVLIQADARNNRPT